jgi:hypothetical protein
MPDPRSLKAERRVQQLFSTSSFLTILLAAMLVVGAHGLLRSLPDRQPRPPALAAVTFEPVRINPAGFAPLRVGGAWRMISSEPRMGGVSALALDRGMLVALTDSGVLIRFPRPGRGEFALFRDLPSGPGVATYKSQRDSEALTRDWAGRGWWVAFENRHSAWLFDPGFARVLRRTDLSGLGWRPNTGAEGAFSTEAGLLLVPESGDELVRLASSRVERLPLGGNFGRLADAARLPDGRIIVLARNYSPAGFSARLLLIGKDRKLRPLARLALGRLANPEAIAAEPIQGGVRLWVMTDNDYRRRVPTLLIALDWID